jgi:hypothetical protein
MQLAQRYACWLEGSLVAETPRLRIPREIPEPELQALWMAGEFGRSFTTTTGGAVKVEKFGAWNPQPGPHFTGAVVVFGDQRIRGGVEVNWNAAEWDRHASASPDYEGTILHVFVREAARERGAAVPATCTAQGREIPQIWLDATRFEFPPSDPPPCSTSPCREQLAQLPAVRIVHLLEAAAQYRLCRKATRLNRIAAEFGPDEALYQGIAEALGYRNNKLPFTLLAQRFPLAMVRSHRTEIEPFLFAGSGFLNATDFHPLPNDTRSYLRELWAQWWPRRTDFERLSVPPGLWNLRGVRPANHPQRRVAALAELARHWPILETLTRTANIPALRHFFGRLTHPYWDIHYTLASKRLESRTALVGESRITDLLLNVIFPRAMTHNPGLWEAYRELPAAGSNRRIGLAAQRLLGGNSELVREIGKRAVLQQGLLEVFENFCLACDADCARCAFPNRLDHLEESIGMN